MLLHKRILMWLDKRGHVVSCTTVYHVYIIVTRTVYDIVSDVL